MMRNNKVKIILSSVIILLPILFGLIMWNKLPDTMTTHWGADGTANGFSDKNIAIFLLPVIILLLHWVCLFVTFKDSKNKKQNKKVFGMIFWICPIISLYSSGFMYATALGMEWGSDSYTLIMIGLMFVIIGNYLPKCKQNHTIGIKVKWALENEENWNATHRLGGKLWVVGGLIILACVFLPGIIGVFVMLSALIILAATPAIYSYVYYQKQVKLGIAPKKSSENTEK